MRATVLFWAGLSVCWAVILNTAHADHANYQRFIVGERAAGMGGAVVSIADSVDACYYNPAGLGNIKGNSLSVAANLYGLNRYKIKNAWYPDENFESTSFISIPTTMSSIFQLGDYPAALGLSVFIPDKTTLHEIDGFKKTGHYTTYSKEEQQLWLGPSIGGYLTTNLSVGVSLFGVYHDFNEFQNVYWHKHPVPLAVSQDVKAYVFNLVSVMGLQYRPLNDWVVGLTFQTPQVTMLENGEIHYQQVIDKNEGEYFYADDLTLKSVAPMKFAVGIGQDVKDLYAWGIDLSWHLPTSYTSLSGRSIDGSEINERTRLKSVVDVNLGGEYIIQKKYPVRAGFFTSFSSAPDVDPDVDNSVGQVDNYGLTCSVGRRSDILDINVGINYLFGTGDDLGYDLDANGDLVRKVVSARENRLYVFFNTSYHF